MAATATVRQINTVGPALGSLFGNGQTMRRAGVGTAILSKALEWAQPVWGAKARRPGLDADYLDSNVELVERCLSGNEAAWEDLVKIHTRRVYGICYRFTGSDHYAQDLTQEVFLRVFRSLKSFRAGEGSFTVWLGRLTRNLLIDHYRRTKQERATSSLE
jgi:hypothetical protein